LLRLRQKALDRQQALLLVVREPAGLDLPHESLSPVDPPLGLALDAALILRAHLRREDARGRGWWRSRWGRGRRRRWGWCRGRRRRGGGQRRLGEGRWRSGWGRRGCRRRGQGRRHQRRRRIALEQRDLRRLGGPRRRRGKREGPHARAARHQEGYEPQRRPGLHAPDRTGSLMIIAVPRPCPDSTSMAPSWSWMIRYTTDNPIPLPSALVV